MRRVTIINCRPAGPLAVLLLLLIAAASCKKYTDEPGQGDPRLTRKYCNDPEAVNFNRDFPGTPDNSVCYYPADAFKGTYTFIDSIYSGTKLQAERTLQLQLTAGSKVKFTVLGLCGNGSGAMTFTANRQLRAVADTTITGKGQLFCRSRDTVSGTLTQSLTDSTRLQFSLNVVSDTGTTLHRGTAYRQ